MKEAEFTLDQANEVIWWLIHLLGGKVTIPNDDQFWEDNLPEEFRVAVTHDDSGNPVLLAQKLDWIH